MAIDGKYGRVTTEHGNIGDDEPVIVFRARDLLAPEVIAHYHGQCLRAGSPMRHLRLVAEAYNRFVEWQNRSGDAQVPDSESSREWMA